VSVNLFEDLDLDEICEIVASSSRSFKYLLFPHHYILAAFCCIIYRFRFTIYPCLVLVPSRTHSQDLYVQSVAFHDKLPPYYYSFWGIDIVYPLHIWPWRQRYSRWQHRKFCALWVVLLYHSSSSLVSDRTLQVASSFRSYFDEISKVRYLSQPFSNILTCSVIDYWLFH
jgi:hypothetical protein